MGAPDQAWEGRLESGSAASAWVSFASMRDAEQRGHEQQRREGREKQAADDGAAERRILSGLDRHRRHADDHRERRHQHRPEARGARLQRGGDRVLAFGELFAREADDENAIGGGDAHAHDGAGQRGHGQRGVSDEQHPDDAGQSGRKRHDDDERIEPGLEIDDDQQVDQDDRKAKADEQLLIGAGHGGRLTANGDGRAFGKIGARIVDDLLDVGRHAAEIAILRRRVDIDGAANVVMRDDRVERLGRERREAAKQLRRLRGGQRQVLERAKRIDVILRRLDRNRIGHAIGRVQPVGRRRLGAARKRRLNAGRRVAFRQSDDAGEFAIEIHLQRRDPGTVPGCADRRRPGTRRIFASSLLAKARLASRSAPAI